MAIIPADIAPEVIQGELRTRIIGHPVEVVAETGSTNDVVMAAGRAGRAEGLAVVADRQTAGRGRRGRSWASAAGVGLYTSILLRPGLPTDRIPLLTLIAGLGVAEAIEERAGIAARLKWPNDVLIEGRKVAGILAEAAFADSRVSHVVLGVGINVNHDRQDLPEVEFPEATSLYLATGWTRSRGQLAATVYGRIDRWYGVLCQRGFDEILASGRARSATLGKVVEVLAREGAWRGVATDLDGDGALLVRTEPEGVRRVIASEVSIRETLQR
jgi:BirA family biotin operon repressor/biotin-[acetyl-CoA-carboxylase] ligase